MVKTQRESLAALLWGSLGILSVFFAWYFLTTYTAAQMLMPPPQAVAEFFWQHLFQPIGRHTIVEHTLWSIYRVVVGYVTGSVAGVIVGAAMGASPIAKAVINPIFEIIRPIPVIAWIPLAILWLGVGEVAKFFIIFIAAFPVLAVSTYAGTTRAVDPVLRGAARMLGCNNRQVFFKVSLPAALPTIFAGLQVSLSNCWMAVLAAEMVRSNMGAGWVILAGMDFANTTQILAGMVAIALAGASMVFIMRKIEQRLLAWNIR